MKSIVICYSYSGLTRAAAQKLAEENGADFIEVDEAKKRSKFACFLLGCPQAMRQKAPALKSPLPDLGEYESITVAAPIWAGFPAPAFNSVIASLPKGKSVSLLFTAASGEYRAEEKVRALVDAQGCTVSDIKIIATTAPKK